jgi:hypothetical protein
MSSLGFQAEGCRLMAQSGHSDPRNECLLWRVKRTSAGRYEMSANDPKATFGTGHFALKRAEQIDLRIGKDKPLSKYRREIARDALGDPRMLLAEAVELLDWQFQARHV